MTKAEYLKKLQSIHSLLCEARTQLEELDSAIQELDEMDFTCDIGLDIMAADTENSEGEIHEELSRIEAELT